MGMMFRRNRPIARLATGAAVAGVAYHAGKSHERRAQADEEAQVAYDMTEQPQYAPPPPAEPAAVIGLSADADLDHLVELYNAGVLSEDEFTAAKAKLLGL